MATKIRVGIVGATVTPGGSGWGASAHVPALHALPGYELAAVCTAHEATAQASAAAFGAALAFHDIGAMVAHPAIDLVAVVVRVPGHNHLVVKALEAGKMVFCEWPLGASLAEAESMAGLAGARALRTAVGLQARSDPTLLYARELIREGYVGEVVAASYRSVGQAITRRGPGRIWQGDRRNGANTLTIAGGHAVDALCFLVGEIEEVSAHLATRIPEWHNTETGVAVAVDSPDWISLSGRLGSGAEVSFLVATVPAVPAVPAPPPGPPAAPAGPGANRLEVYGRGGTLVVSGGSPNTGPNHLYGARGGAPLEALEPPARFTLIPQDTPAGSPRNVAQAYARFAAAVAADEPFHPDFAHAVTRHALIAAIERSAAERRTVRV